MVKIGNIELGEFPLLLAPMEDVSDPPFRSVCKQLGADLMCSEFISSEGLIRDADKSVKKLDVFDHERPIAIQIFGAEFQSMMQATRIVEAAQPDIIDINYGCPVKKVVSKNAGAAILKDIVKMEKLTKAVVDSTYLPVTVKTRLGWDRDSIRIVEVAERLQDAGIKAISIHGRTRKQMYKGEADWKPIAEVKNNPRMKIPVFCNGDVDSPQKANLAKTKFGFDGVMIGRAAIGYPWIFQEIKHFLETGELLQSPGTNERVEVCKNHFLRSLDWKGEALGILEMRRHYSHYFKGYKHIKPFRMKLVTSENKDEILETLEKIREFYVENEMTVAG